MEVDSESKEMQSKRRAKCKALKSCIRLWYVIRVFVPEEWGLLIQCVAVERGEGGGDEDSVASEKHGRGGVDSEVPTGSVRASEASVHIRGSVSLSVKEVLALWRGFVVKCC
jgi:hypothetical protein